MEYSHSQLRALINQTFANEEKFHHFLNNSSLCFISFCFISSLNKGTTTFLKQNPPTGTSLLTCFNHSKKPKKQVSPKANICGHKGTQGTWEMIQTMTSSCWELRGENIRTYTWHCDEILQDGSMNIHQERWDQRSSSSDQTGMDHWHDVNSWQWVKKKLGSQNQRQGWSCFVLVGPCRGPEILSHRQFNMGGDQCMLHSASY